MYNTPTYQKDTYLYLQHENMFPWFQSANSHIIEKAYLWEEKGKSSSETPKTYCWWFRNSANQLSLVVEIPLFAKAFATSFRWFSNSPDFWTNHPTVGSGPLNFNRNLSGQGSVSNSFHLPCQLLNQQRLGSINTLKGLPVSRAGGADLKKETLKVTRCAPDHEFTTRYATYIQYTYIYIYTQYIYILMCIYIYIYTLHIYILYVYYIYTHCAGAIFAYTIHTIA